MPQSTRLAIPDNRQSVNESRQQALDELKQQQEKKNDIDQKNLQKMLDKLQSYFSKFVLNLQMNINTLAVKIKNNDGDEVMIVKYGNEEIVVDIDLVFKERTHLKILGLEVESRHGFNVFMKLANDMIPNLQKIKDQLED
jgi:uncharacterized FlaG/YvyC family protein